MTNYSHFNITPPFLSIDENLLTLSVTVLKAEK